MHFEMPVQINEETNEVTFTTPDGKSSLLQYPKEWSEAQIMEDFVAKLKVVPNVKSITVDKVPSN